MVIYSSNSFVVQKLSMMQNCKNLVQLYLHSKFIISNMYHWTHFEFDSAKRCWLFTHSNTLLILQQLSGIEFFLIGAVAKAVATVLTYPLQVAQCRQRVGCHLNFTVIQVSYNFMFSFSHPLPLYLLLVLSCFNHVFQFLSSTFAMNLRREIFLQIFKVILSNRALQVTNPYRSPFTLPQSLHLITYLSICLW